MTESMLGRANNRFLKALKVVQGGVLEEYLETIEKSLDNLGEEEIGQIEELLGSIRTKVREVHQHAAYAKALAEKEAEEMTDEMANASTVTHPENRPYLISVDHYGLWEYLLHASDDSLRVVADGLDQARLAHIVQVLQEK